MAKHDKDAAFVGDSRVPAKRIPNIAPSYSDFPGKSEAFYPNFLLKEWMVAAVCLLGFLVLCVSHVPELTGKANPNDTSFIPLPDWYFLFLYQFLKYPWVAGKEFVVLGTVVIPGLAFGALFLAPWLDGGTERRFYRRPVASGIMFIALIMIFYLTWESMYEHNKNHASNQGSGSHNAPAAEADPNFKADPLWTAQASCVGCHGQNLEGAMGPGLQKVGSKLNAQQIEEIIKNGKGAMPGGMFKGSEEELKKLSEYLASLK